MPRDAWELLDDHADALGWWLDYWHGRHDQAKWRLVEHYAGLAQRTAWARARSTGQMDHVLDQHDLSQELMLVLAELVETFNPFHCVPFRKFAAPRLAKRVISIQRDDDFVGRFGRQKGCTAELVPIEKRQHNLKAPAGDNSEQIYIEQLLEQLDPDDAAFARLRWVECMELKHVAAALGKCQSWAYFRQMQVMPRLARAMGREDLATKRPCRRTGPRVSEAQRRAA